MPAVPACPSPLELRHFLLGQASNQDADRLEEHMEQCVACQHALRELDVHDNLVQIARAVAATPLTTPPAAVASLINRLVRLSVFAAGDVQTTTDERTAVEVALELRSLLAPPQGPDEIGRLGPYRVLDVLGSGGMGVVFRAEDPQLGRFVALKVIKPGLAASAQARQRLLREARTAAALEHDHIVPLYHVGEEGGIPFLAFQLLKGETLDDRLKREGRLPVAEVLRIGRELAAGLAAAHTRGLIHRDIKPANVWLEAAPGQAGSTESRRPAVGGRVKILDFGIARAVAEVQEGLEEKAESTESASLTQPGAILGTPAFMAPEQARGGTVDARADLFSLGAVLYCLATGRVPFAGTKATAVLAAVERDQPVPPRTLNPQVPPGLSQLILKLLAKHPADRPCSAQAVAESLAALAPSGRRRWWAMAGAGLLAALLVLAAPLLMPKKDMGPPDGQADATDIVVAGVDFVEAGRFDVGRQPFRMAVGDLNGDGKMDLVVTNVGINLKDEKNTQGVIGVYLGNGDGTFQPAVHYPGGNTPVGVVVADLDRDGKADIVVVNSQSHDISVLLGNGDGSFRSAISYAAGPHPFHLVSGDFNGDGKLDLAVANNFHRGGVSVLLGKGDGTFRPAVFWATGVHPSRIVAGDLNGDGRLDLAVANTTGGTVSVLLGNGDGTFRSPIHHRMETPVLAGLADMDGDGKLDLVVGKDRAWGVRFLLGKGDGTFRDGSQPSRGMPVILADFNGDGTVDLIALEGSSPTMLYAQLGNGRGAYRTSRAKRLPFHPGTGVVGDFNGDGRPDLAILADNDGKGWVLLNRPVVQRLTAVISHRQLEVGQSAFLILTAQDAVGGTVASYPGTVRITCDGQQKGLPSQYPFTAKDKGVRAFDPVLFARPGKYTITVTDLAHPALKATATVNVVSRQP